MASFLCSTTMSLASASPIASSDTSPSLFNSPYAGAYIANAQILEQVTRSVKSRRKVKKQQHGSDVVRLPRKKLSSPSAAAVASQSRSQPSTSSFTRTKLALQDAMLQASKLMDNSAAGEDVEVLRSSKQSTTSSSGSTKLSRRPATPGTALISQPQRRKRTNKALGHALRRSRDLRSLKQQEVQDMLTRPLPSVPTTASCKPATVTLADESPIVPQLFTSSSSSSKPPVNRLLHRKPVPIEKTTQGKEVDENDDSTDDWATFIASGYRDFPMPPTSDIRDTMAAALHNRRQQAQARLSTVKPKRRSAAIAPLQVPWQDSNGASKTGVDWLDDELARASGGEEDREELRSVNSPKTASSLASSVGLGLMRSARTPPSSSVDTFQSQPTPPLLLSPPKGDGRNGNEKWRLSSAANEVFVTPDSSPRIEYGQMTTAPSESPAMVKQAIDLAAAHAQIERRPSCASSYKVHFVNDVEHREHDDDVFKRHDSVSSAASSAVSRDFSVAESSSTRRTSIGGGSECSSSVTHGSHVVGPTHAMGGAGDAKALSLLACYTINSSGAARRISMSSNDGGATPSPRTNNGSSDSAASSPRRRRASSRVPFPKDGAPTTPIRTASLQNQQAAAAVAASKRSIDIVRHQPLMGSWLEESSAHVVPVPMTHSQSSPGLSVQKTSTSVVPRTSTEVLAVLREQKASKSHADLPLRTSISDDAGGEKSKNGLRSFFGASRPRRQSSTLTPELRSQVYLADAAQNASSVTLTDKQQKMPKKLTVASRSRSSGNLDRLLAKMSGSPIDLLLPPRPLADVPITPASADAFAPESPSQLIFGSAASFLGGAGGGGGAGYSALHAAMAAHCSKQMSEQMRLFAEASHAVRRTSSVCVTDMPTQIAGDVAAMERHLASCNRKLGGGSLSRAASLRSRAHAGLPDFQVPSQSSKHGSGDASAPNVPAKDSTVAAMRAARQANNKPAAPPVAFWRRNGVYADDGPNEDVDCADVDDRTVTSRPVVRRKSSFTLWR